MRWPPPVSALCTVTESNPRAVSAEEFDALARLMAILAPGA